MLTKRGGNNHCMNTSVSDGFKRNVRSVEHSAFLLLRISRGFFLNFAYFPWPCMVLYFRRRDKWIGKIISFDDKEVWDVEHSVSVGETCQLRFFWTNVYNLK